jgi:hypothetical protein
MQYKYSLDNSSKKYLCPQCKRKSFVAYVDNETKAPVDPFQFGRCDKENKCGYHITPYTDPELAAQAKKDFVPVPDPEVIQIFPDEEIIARITNKTKTCISPLHRYCSSKLIPSDHLLKWGVYSDDDKTVYIFRNAAQQVCNLKWFKYKEDGHRDKEFDSYSLKNPSPPVSGRDRSRAEGPNREGPPHTPPKDGPIVFLKKYLMCLFGEHLLDNTKQKIVCVVESEKTAAIASYFYPQFDWVACGSNNGLTDGQNGRPDKISVLKGRKVYWLSDADKASRMDFFKKQDGSMEIRPSSIRHLEEHKIDFEVVDLFPDRNDGYDICDAILDGTRPEIKPTPKPSLEKPKVENGDEIEYDLPDGVEFEKVKWDIRKYMHFEHNGKIYIVRKRKGGQDFESKGVGNYYCSPITNFTIKSLGLIASELDPSRLVEIKNIHGFTQVVQVPTKAFTSQTEFRNFIESVGNFQYDGMGNDLNKIRSKLYDTMHRYDEVKRLGWQQGYFVWANGAYNGKFEAIDKYGFVKLGEKNFFIQPLSCITRENSEDWEDEKKFVFKKRDVKLRDWAELFCRVHKDNGRIALAWYITSLFRDVIYQRFKFFPHLFLFGPPGTGKSQIGWSIRAMGFCGLKKPFNLNSGTDVSFFREMAQYVNFPCWYDEFGLGVEWKRAEALKNAYDGAGHAKAVEKSETRSKKTPVHSACLISGQSLPVMDNALFKRVILTQFHQTEYTTEERELYMKLQALEDGGLTHITAGFMHFRKLIEEKYLAEFEIVLVDMIKSAADMQFEVEDRILRNSCVILTTIKLLQQDEKMADKLPYTYDQLKAVIMKNVKEQMLLISNANETNTFWDMVEFLIREKKIEEGLDFIFDEKKILKILVGRDDKDIELPKTTELVMVRFSKIIPLYRENFRRQNAGNTAAMDKGSLIHYLQHSKPFIGSVGKVTFKDGSRTSAYCFNYEMLKAMGINLGNVVAPPAQGDNYAPAGSSGASQGAIGFSNIKTAPKQKDDEMPF